MLAPVSEMGANLLFHELDEEDELSEALAVLAAAGDYNLKIIVKPNWSRDKWVRGQFALYPVYGEAFNHENCIGQADDALEAWTAQTETDEPGWLQRDLIINYQQGDESWTALSEYSADFFLAVGENTNPETAATLYVVAKDTLAAAETILDSLNVQGTDFEQVNSVQPFRLQFSCAGLPNTQLMDYRIYWTGQTDLTVFSTVVMDSLAEALQVEHNFDTAIETEIEAVESAEGYENLLWWDLIDEPAYDQLSGAEYVHQQLQTAGETPFINFYPGYALQFQHEAPDFDTYLTDFVTALNPPVLSFDHYPFGWTAEDPDLPRFFTDLAYYREKSLAFQLPFWYTAQGFNFNDLGFIDETRMRLCVFSALAYGAKGIMWWRFKDGMSDACFVPNQFYEQAQAVNEALTLIGPDLMGLTSTGAAALPFDTLPLGLSILAVSGDSLVVGTFTQDSLSTDWFMLVNFRFTGSIPSTPTITLAPAGEPRLVEDLLALRSPEPDSLHLPQLMLSAGTDAFQVNLLPGEGRLFRVSTDLLPGDLNRDGEVTIQDVVFMVDLILSEDGFSVYELWSGDLSGDDTLDILDVLHLVMIILSH